jgi:rare lipoprotein A
MKFGAGIGASAPLLMIGLLVAGCGSQQRSETYLGSGNGAYVAGRPMYRVGQPYQVKGIWYYPTVDLSYDKTGIASWYGEQFDGRYTANGEIFNLNELTAAHTTLPMPCIVQVTNLENGRSLELRVNDRGPFVDGRLIDVSRRAAQLLGFETKGTTPVRVKIDKDASIKVAEAAMHNGGGTVLVAQMPAAIVPVAQAAPLATRTAPPSSVLASNVIAGPIVDTRIIAPPPSPAPSNIAVRPVAAARMPLSQPSIVAALPSRIFVQAGAFSVRDNAQKVQSRIAPLGSVEVMSASVNGTAVYRVRLGPVASVEQADQLLHRVVNSGYPEARIVTN